MFEFFAAGIAIAAVVISGPSECVKVVQVAIVGGHKVQF